MRHAFKKLHKIYVYGTLMKNDGRPKIDVHGRMFDLGWYPGVIAIGVAPTVVKCEVIEVDDKALRDLDAYEGYNEHRPYDSLYIRKWLDDGWIYQYNHDPVGGVVVASGDWADYLIKKKELISG